MTENNTTGQIEPAEICYNALNETVACVSESASIFDDIEVILLSIGVLLGIAAWAKQKYASMMADGKITLDELTDSIGEAKEKAAEAEEAIKDIETTLESHNVTELKAMLKEAGLSVKGKKADLIARLEAHKGGE